MLVKSDCLKRSKEESRVQGRLKFLLICLVFLLCCTALSRVVYSQGSLCYFTTTQVNPGEGDSVPAGQPIQFQITLIGSCPTPGIYTIRADLTNPATSQVLSTDQEQLAANGQFIVTLSESLVAPSTIGTWNLQLSAYVLLGGAVAAPASQQTFGLNIVPFTATSTVAMTQTTIVESTNTTSPSIQSTIPQTSTTSFSTASSATQAVGASGTLVTELQLVVALLVILVLLFLLIRAKRQPARAE